MTFNLFRIAVTLESAVPEDVKGPDALSRQSQFESANQRGVEPTARMYCVRLTSSMMASRTRQ